MLQLSIVYSIHFVSSTCTCRLFAAQTAVSQADEPSLFLDALLICASVADLCVSPLLLQQLLIAFDSVLTCRVAININQTRVGNRHMPCSLASLSNAFSCSDA